jgi:hypothetical protein
VTTSTQHFSDSTQVQERRLHPRIFPKSLIYVAFGSANGGMVLNASDQGFAISMAIPVGKESFSSLHVRLNGLPTSIDARGRITWASQCKKRAGIQLLDLTDSQCEKIQQWLSLDGEREINLLPSTTVENQAPVEGFIAPAAIAAATSSVGTNPSLLDRFGGTPPESLGPSAADTFVVETARHVLRLPEDFDSFPANNALDKNWDLADVALLPRRKPEGLSAFAFILLWIAIPILAIGVYVERRPLAQWLNRGDAYTNSVSHDAPRGGAADDLRSQTPGKNASDARVVPAREDQQTPPNTRNPERSADSSNVSDTSGAEYSREPGSNANTIAQDNNHSVDRLSNSATTTTPANSDLLNSLSFQETRARINPAGVSANANVGNPKLSNTPVPSNSPVSSSIRASGVGTSQNLNSHSVYTPTPASGQRPDSAPGASDDRLSKTISADSDVNMPTDRKSHAIAMPEAQSFAPTSPAITEPTSTAGRVAPNSSSVLTGDSHRNGTSLETASTGPTSLPPATKPSPMATSSVSPAISPNASSPSAIAPKAVSNSASAPGTANSAMPPPHGVLMVARKSDESFLLKLPTESIAGEASTSIRMQRSIMVPREGRWHHRGPIAKVTVGELTSRVIPNNSDTGVKPRAGESVTVRAFVNKHGDVEDLTPVSGRFALMPRVMRAVRDWQYDPTLVDGKPVESEINVTIEFRPNH